MKTESAQSSTRSGVWLPLITEMLSMQLDVRIAEQQKVGIQGRDYSIKQFSVQLPLAQRSRELKQFFVTSELFAA